MLTKSLDVKDAVNIIKREKIEDTIVTKTLPLYMLMFGKPDMKKLCCLIYVNVWKSEEIDKHLQINILSQFIKLRDLIKLNVQTAVYQNQQIIIAK